MKDVCIVPTYRRPEYLWVCLEQLCGCEGIQELQVVIAIDNHVQRAYDPEVLRVARAFQGRLPLDVTTRPPHRYEGNSSNVLLAYGEALAAGARYAFLVEDDIMVLPDFFRWHYAVQAAEPDIFASVASPNKHVTAWPQRGDPAAYFTSPAYASHGVCLAAASIERLLPHISPDYLGDMPGYMRRCFPHSRLGERFTEQDGLIDRIIEADGLRNAWPCAPRAFHTGFWGYHRTERTRLGGTLEERVERLRKLVDNTEALNRLSRHYKDLDGLSPTLAAWVDQTKVGVL